MSGLRKMLEHLMGAENLVEEEFSSPPLKNLIKNPSGYNGHTGWKITANGGDGWDIEKKPVHSSPVPTTPFLGINHTPNDTFCFVTSHGWSSKSYLIDLVKEIPGPLNQLIPFEIRCGQMYGTRGDCGGKFKWELNLLDSTKTALKEYHSEYELEQGENWQSVEHTFKFGPGDAKFLERVKYLEFVHEGKDNKFWAGHYGMKFARSTVVVVSQATPAPVLKQQPQTSLYPNLEDNLQGRNKVPPKRVTLDQPNTSGNLGHQDTKYLPSPPSTKLPLQIRTLDGKTYKIIAKTDWNVLRLKQEFEKWHGGDAEKCLLYYKAKRLQDNSILESYKIGAGDFVMANFRSVGEI